MTITDWKGWLKYHPGSCLAGTDDLRPGVKSCRRVSQSVMSNYKTVLENIAASEQMKGFWRKYQTDFDYAKDIDFTDVCHMIVRVFDEIGF
ncbi:MAG: hypothetical protein AB1796_06245 [Bacillota bacterium]